MINPMVINGDLTNDLMGFNGIFNGIFHGI